MPFSLHAFPHEQASVRSLSSNSKLSSNGVRQRSCTPQPITVSWLVDRTALASQPLLPATAAAIVKTLVLGQLIDNKTGLLLEVRVIKSKNNHDETRGYRNFSLLFNTVILLVLFNGIHSNYLQLHALILGLCACAP